jgi:hypothetical protein
VPHHQWWTWTRRFRRRRPRRLAAASPQLTTYATPNKGVWILRTYTQLLATWHTDWLDMVVLPSTGVSLYHNCCINDVTSPEYFGYHLVFEEMQWK